MDNPPQKLLDWVDNRDIHGLGLGSDQGECLTIKDLC